MSLSPATRALALPDRDVSALQKADEPRPVAAAAFDNEGWQAELQRPGERRAIPTLARLDLAALELRAEPIESDRDMDVLVRVDADCHRHSIT
jgi:hypothetical protein